jgi:hypothetical protein
LRFGFEKRSNEFFLLIVAYVVHIAGLVDAGEDNIFIPFPSAGMLDKQISSIAGVIHIKG